MWWIRDTNWKNEKARIGNGKRHSVCVGKFYPHLLTVGLIASAVALIRGPKPLTTPAVVEALFAYFLLLSIGFSLFYNFVLHTFFGEMSASFIGWKTAPFQAEVGFAGLGYAAVGFLAFRRSFELRLAAVTGPSLFLLCAGVAHVYQIITAHNFAPGKCRGDPLIWTS